MKRMELFGNLGKIEVPDSDDKPVKFSVCVDRPIKRGQTWRTEPEWFYGFAFDAAGRALANHCRVGSQVLLEGVPEMQTWEDRDGKRHARMTFKVFRVHFGARCGQRAPGADGEQEQEQRPSAPASGYHRRSRGDDLDNPHERGGR